MLHPSERKVMTWVQYCVIEIDDLFYYLCFVCMCMCAYAPRVLRQHIVTLVVFGHQRPRWQRLKWWLRTGGLDGKMWINEAQIELIAMTSHNSGAAKWEYVVGPQESQRLFLLSRWWWEWGRQSCTSQLTYLTSPVSTTKRRKAVFLSGGGLQTPLSFPITTFYLWSVLWRLGCRMRMQHTVLNVSFIWGHNLCLIRKSVIPSSSLLPVFDVYGK